MQENLQKLEIHTHVHVPIENAYMYTLNFCCNILYTLVIYRHIRFDRKYHFLNFNYLTQVLLQCLRK